MIRSSRYLAVAAVFVAAGALHAQQPAPAQALHEQIDRIFKDHAYAAPRFGPARWLPDGSAYAIVERPTAGSGGAPAGSEIVRYDAATGARSVVVAAERLVPPGQASPLDVDDYAWSDDGHRLLIFTNTKKVWRRNTRGDYWVLDVGTGRLTQVGAGAPESSLMFAKFSPDGTRVAYVRANNIYVEHLGDGRTVQVTHDGSKTTINGTSDWVNEEELSIRDGFRWSPDGRQIAYWQFDTTGVGVYTLIDDTDSLYPTIRQFAYPKPGTTNSATRIGVVDAGGGPTRWMKVPGDPREHYLATLEWIDARTLAIQQLNRLQNRDDYLLADAATGTVTRAFRDESTTWVDAQDAVPWIDHGAAFLWLSERDGWRHVYRVPRAGGAPTLLTRFDADVLDLVGTDESRGVLYFIASPSNATQRYLYRAPLDGSAAPVRVTPADESGTHTYDLAPGGHLAFHTWSSFDRPPAMDVVELPDHRSLRALTNPSALEAKLAAVLQPPAKFFKVDIGGGVTLDGWMIEPASFDPARRYPVIVNVYGEPASVTVVDRWGGNTALFHRALADAGYIVVSFDNRGTPAPKGAAWRKVIYGTVGDLSSKEQAAAIRAFAATHPFVDPDRIGVWGWSGGGSNTLNCMFRFPDVYKVGVSVAPVPDQRLYGTIYQERYMGLPQQNAEGYRIGSPINFADGLKGHLLVVHGSGDDNVHYQGTERLVNQLVALGKPFDLMVYPNRTHAISEGPGTTPHLYHLIARYFLEHLPPQAPAPSRDQVH
ncbi:MAG TPA: S9 family peptidase [Vicinamibacterales bacterium]|nr:S9 family peptidase [Vicinamibacterales bacterium]